MPGRGDLFGVLAEFDGPDELVAASRRVHEAGYKRFESYSPFPIHGLAEAMGFAKTRLPMIVLMGGITGAIAGYALPYWVSAIEYPLNVGGRPYNSWPSFIPVIFEMTVLFAALAAVLGMLALNRLPRPHHPLFALEKFTSASRDGFFLCILKSDPQFDEEGTREFIKGLEPKEMMDVRWD